MADLRTNYPTGAPFDAAKWNGSDANGHAAAINEHTSDIAEQAAALAGKIDKSVGATKGDIAVFNGSSWQRQAKGVNGQGLVYDDTTATGVKAGTVAASNYAPDPDNPGLFMPSSGLIPDPDNPGLFLPTGAPPSLSMVEDPPGSGLFRRESS